MPTNFNYVCGNMACCCTNKTNCTCKSISTHTHSWRTLANEHHTSYVDSVLKETWSFVNIITRIAVCMMFEYFKEKVVVGGLVAKSCPTLATPWTIALQAPLSMGFSRQEYWSGLPFPSPRDLLNPGIKPRSPALQADSLQLSYKGSHHGDSWAVSISSLLIVKVKDTSIFELRNKT